MSSHRSLRAGFAAAVTAGAGLLAVAVPGVASAHASAHAVSRPAVTATKAPAATTPKKPSLKSLAPKVVHTGTAPTGYEVTFHFYDPTASSVRIRGEWYFSNPAETTTTTSQGLLPSQWAPGDFPIAFPNQGAAPNWPVANMTFDASTGVWSYTTPMASGTYTYGFYVNCSAAAPALTGCTELPDPANLPWNVTSNGGSTGSVEPDSEVYVPSDPAFGTQNLNWEKPHPGQGTLQDVSYPDPLSITPAGTHPLAVFLPPGYDPNRATPYPTLYLSHGGGGQEVDWSTQGVAGNILDNLISSGQIQPMVVVMTNFNGFPFTDDTYARDLLTNVIPYVQSHYNVAAGAANRAFAGLSVGGYLANGLLFNHTSSFSAYSVMSNAGGTPTAPLTATQKQALRKVQIQVGGGIQDPLRPLTTTEQAFLSKAGVPYTDDSINGGHEWYVWRILLHDFLVNQAFHPVA